MSSQELVSASLSVENVGGIESTEVRFEPGVTVLAGRNATNRTSLLRSIMGALGSDAISLKADAEEGTVELEIGGETYTRNFARQNGTVVTSGDPYLTDPDTVELADLFAFLLESNEARRAVASEDDLHDILMRPIDTAQIEHEINKFVARRDDIDEELRELEELAEELPAKETRRQEIAGKLEEIEANIEAKQAEVQKADESLESRREDQTELDDRMSELEGSRADLTHTRQRLRTERKSIKSLEEELSNLEANLEDLSETEEIDGDIESRLQELRDRQDRLDTDLNELQSIIQFNEKMLDGSSHAVTEALGASEAAPTDQLLPDEDRDATCWTCGSQVEQSELEATLKTFREVRSEKLEERSAVRDEIDELTELKRNQREIESERRRLERRMDETNEEIEERETRIEELEADREDLESRVEELEEEVREMQTEEQDELLELNRELNELEFERDQLENELEDISAEIDRIESRLERRGELEDEREEVSERLEDLRTRIDRMETAAVDEFNDHMERVLDILEYENLDRIWIERKQVNGDSHFDLHVIRTTEDGAAYEDSIDHLSESEREVVGLVFALAGYLVHDVHETVPYLLLDSLEALDSGRIAELVEYFGQYADSLVVALLPEDAAAVNDKHQRISDI